MRSGSPKCQLEEIDEDFAKLNDVQASDLTRLADLLDRSTDVSNAFAHYGLSQEDQRRAAFLFEWAL